MLPLLTLLAGSWLPAAADAPDDPGLLLLTHEAEGFVPAARIAADETRTLPIPLRTLSERRPRAVRTARGFGFRVAGDRAGLGFEVDVLRVVAVRHPRGSEVLDGPGGLVLVGPPQLGEGTPPVLARHDGFGADGAHWHLYPERSLGTIARPGVPVDGDVQPVAIPLERRDGRDVPRIRPPRDAASSCAHLARVGPDSPYSVALGCGCARFGKDVATAEGVDQLFWADIRPIDELQRVLLDARLSGSRPPAPYVEHRRGGLGRAWSVPDHGRMPALRGRIDGHDELAREGDGGPDPALGGALEVWFAAPPTAPEGETWTLLVTVRAAAPPVQARPVRPAEAAAPVPPLFVDVAPAHLAALVHLEGPAEQLDIRPTMGPGAAWGDASGDGRPDLYLVQGAGRGAVVHPNRLHVQDASARLVWKADAGVGDTGAGMGALFLDADADGDLDLYVANYGADVLYRNRGDATFDDVSATAGVGGDLWSAGIAAADTDRDGDLDLYVTSYLEYDEAQMPPPDELDRYRREDPVAMLPFAFPGQRNVFLRNASTPEALRFEDATEELGLLDVQGRGMQPVFLDFDRDGWQDLYVANDVSYNVLWRNRGDGTFEDVSFSTGMDDPRGGMGLALGDVDLDGDEDVFLTNWQLDANALYRNELLSHESQRHRVATFRDVVVEAGLGQLSVGVTSWGCSLGDLDLDGAPDLYVANGYTSPDYESTGICVGQPDHLFLGDGDGRFAPAFELAGPDVAAHLPSRAVAACDFDRDGDLDLLVTANNSAVRLLESRATDLYPDRRWLGVELRAADGTRAVGAEVVVRAGDVAHVRTVRAGSSYLAGEPPEVHVGLGQDATLEGVEVRWPSGRTTTHPDLALDTWHVLHEAL